MQPTKRIDEARRLKRAIWAAALSLSIAGSLTACADSHPDAIQSNSGGTQGSSERFWQTFRIAGDEVEPYASFESMAETADATVLARFDEVGEFRTITGDANDAVHYVSINLTVTRDLAETGVPSSVPLEFMVIPSRGQEIESVAEEINAALPKGEMVVFLRAKKGVGEEGLYRILNSRGLWTSTTREDLDAPLAEEPVNDDAKYAGDLVKASNVAELADLVDNMR